MKNRSRQREAITRVLRSLDTHPTARQVYDLVRQEIPNISLGTVYRNLADLSANGDILSIGVGDGFEHFDGDTSPHIHLRCRKCGCIEDAVLKEDFLLKTAKEHSFIPDAEVLVVYGTCANCNQGD